MLGRGWAWAAPGGHHGLLQGLSPATKDFIAGELLASTIFPCVQRGLLIGMHIAFQGAWLGHCPLPFPSPWTWLEFKYSNQPTVARPPPAPTISTHSSMEQPMQHASPAAQTVWPCCEAVEVQLAAPACYPPLRVKCRLEACGRPGVAWPCPCSSQLSRTPSCSRPLVLPCATCPSPHGHRTNRAGESLLWPWLPWPAVLRGQPSAFCTVLWSWSSSGCSWPPCQGQGADN